MGSGRRRLNPRTVRAIYFVTGSLVLLFTSVVFCVVVAWMMMPSNQHVNWP
jgi:hypothetical protein